MKKYVLFALSLILALSMFGCQKKPTDTPAVSLPETESEKSTEAPKPEKTTTEIKYYDDGLIMYLEEKEGESSEYNTAIKVYNQFLNEKIEAIDKNTLEMTGANNAWNPLDFKSSIISYASYDINHDGIPELFTCANTYCVFSYINGQLWFLYETNSNIMHGPTYILENGAIFSKHLSTGYTYNYVTIDSEGTVTQVTFRDPVDDYEGAFYLFNNEEVSKEKFKQLTKEYMELSQKKADVEWHSYKK